MKRAMGEPSPTELQTRLLAWYDANRRDLPWRRTGNPYHILVAEYLLQRTRIVSGTPYYERFLRKFPTVQNLAAAPLDDVLTVWEGLGFYGRARRLHAAARAIGERHGAFNQAMMELGATVCTPTSPSCPRCPVERACLARAAGEERELPMRRSPRSTPVVPVVFGLVTASGHVLLVRRPRGRLLGGLWALPGGERIGRSDKGDLVAAVRSQTGVDVEVAARWSRVHRTFSHRKWSGSIYRCTPRATPVEGRAVRWLTREDALRLPLVPFHREAIEALAGIESYREAD